MFQLTVEVATALRSQNATLKTGRGAHRKYLPYAFTEHGAIMAATILNSMPPDVLAKVQALAQILQEGVKEGRLTDAEIQRDMLSGRLAEKIKQLSPEANQLLQDISSATQEGTGPGQDKILPLLQGLGSRPN